MPQLESTQQIRRVAEGSCNSVRLSQEAGRRLADGVATASAVATATDRASMHHSAAVVSVAGQGHTSVWGCRTSVLPFCSRGSAAYRLLVLHTCRVIDRSYNRLKTPDC